MVYLKKTSTESLPNFGSLELPIPQDLRTAKLTARPIKSYICWSNAFFNLNYEMVVPDGQHK
mgnify:CR=1 FL=1